MLKSDCFSNAVSVPRVLVVFVSCLLSVRIEYRPLFQGGHHQAREALHGFEDFVVT